MCISTFNSSVAGVSYPVLNGIYTIRNFHNSPSGKIGLRFEEIRNAKREFREGYGEPSFIIRCFRELQPNEELSETTVEQLIKELELTPQTT